LGGIGEEGKADRGGCQLTDMDLEILEDIGEKLDGLEDDSWLDIVAGQGIDMGADREGTEPKVFRNI